MITQLNRYFISFSHYFYRKCIGKTMKMLLFTQGLLGDLHLPSIGGSASFTSSSAEASTSSRHTFSLHFSFNPFLHFLTTRATFCLINDLSGRFFTTEETGESDTILRSMSNKFPKKQHRFFFLQKEARINQDNVFFSFFIADGVWRIKAKTLTKRDEKKLWRINQNIASKKVTRTALSAPLISLAFTHGQIVNECSIKSNDAEGSGLALHQWIRSYVTIGLP